MTYFLFFLVSIIGCYKFASAGSWYDIDTQNQDVKASVSFAFSDFPSVYSLSIISAKALDISGAQFVVEYQIVVSVTYGNQNWNYFIDVNSVKDGINFGVTQCKNSDKDALIHPSEKCATPLDGPTATPQTPIPIGNIWQPIDVSTPDLVNAANYAFQNFGNKYRFQIQDANALAISANSFVIEYRANVAVTQLDNGQVWIYSIDINSYNDNQHYGLTQCTMNGASYLKDPEELCKTPDQPTFAISKSLSMPSMQSKTANTYSSSVPLNWNTLFISAFGALIALIVVAFVSLVYKKVSKNLSTRLLDSKKEKNVNDEKEDSESIQVV